MATDEQRSDCWDKAIHAFGTAYIFEQRFSESKKKQRWLVFLGIAVPVLVGGVVIAFFGIDQLKPFVGGLIILAALASTAQLIVTIWSLVAKWEDQAIYGSESSVENYEISRLYADLAKNNPADFASKYELLNLRNNIRSAEDGKKEITERYKRMGMRAALRKYQRACVKCTQVPVDMNATECPICGNY
jgi:mobilome CxxCx(11)CxxC protein